MGFLLSFLFLVLCMFPAFASGNVVVNEIAWMGTTNSASDEWIELYSTDTADLTDWHLITEDGAMDIALSGSITAGGYVLIERTDDTTVPDISADIIAPFGSGLSNNGEVLILKNSSGTEVDKVHTESPPVGEGWPAGDNITKETMQKSGGAWITAMATPKAANISAGSSKNNLETDEENEIDSGSGGGDPEYIPPEKLPRIKTDAGEDQTAAVGEQVQFRAHAWGLDDKALENARYVWNFGDGATHEGQNVGYAYMFPGTYMARLMVSSGKYSAFDDLRVLVQKNTVMISEVMPGAAGWIELQNAGNKSIHLGGWILETTTSRFIFPLGTIMAPNSFAVLSAQTTRVVPNGAGDRVYLFYPNGTYANGFQYVFEAPQGKSVSNNAGVSVFTEPTPGNSNKLVLTQQIVFVPIVSKSPVTEQKTKQQPQLVILEQEEPVDGSNTRDSSGDLIFQSATLTDAPPLSKMDREAIWFGGSLIAGGFAAVGVVLFRRRRSSMSDTIL